jgi:ABC-type dipeptide/oligopeptide/nickel transport system permease subunit
MISAGRSYIIASPWIVLFPGIAIAVTALCFNIFGDALSERYGIKKAGL